MSHRGHFENAIARLHRERRYRIFADLERNALEFPRATYRDETGAARDVTVWCTNDYLAMGLHTDVIDALCDTAARVGVGAGGTRNISGTNHPDRRTRGGTRRPSWKGGGAGLHVRLDLQSRRHLHHRRPAARLPDPVG